MASNNQQSIPSPISPVPRNLFRSPTAPPLAPTPTTAPTPSPTPTPASTPAAPPTSNNPQPTYLGGKQGTLGQNADQIKTQRIIDNVNKLKAANAPLADIAQYVSLATKEYGVGSSAPPASKQQQNDDYSAITPQGFGSNMKKATPGALYQTLVGDPAKLLISGGEGAIAGFENKPTATGKTYNLPGLAPFKSFQSEAVDRAKSGQGPVKNILEGTGQTALAGLQTIGMVEGGLKGGKAAYDSLQPTVQTAIDAVSATPKGSQLGKAYADTVTGKRAATPGGIIKPQSIGPDSQAVGLGTRLQDILTSKDPLKNLDSLATNLQETEGKLGPLLENDKTPFIKQSVNDGLGELEKNMPREFIKDPNKSYQDVIAFAQKMVNETEPNMNGLRDARIAFDNQAKIEYPNAFKNGYIDTKTPAGQAIKDARDFISNYLYSTAENGSEAQQLIKRESDIFNASQIIGPKAGESEGASKLSQIGKAIENHPIYSTALTVGADKLLKKFTGLGF